MPLPASVPTIVPTVVVDTREQRPWVFSPRIRVVHRTLESGDYSISGLEGRVAIERKTLDDLLRSLTHERARFMGEMARLVKYEFAAVLVEAELVPMMEGRYRSGATPQSMLASCAAIAVDFGVPVYFCGNRGCAATFAEELLVRVARRAQVVALDLKTTA